jgi:Ca-activated chloride channel homolog
MNLEKENKLMRVFINIGLALLFTFSTFAQTQSEVVVPETFLRELPSPTAKKIQTVNKGDKITFIKTQETDGWYYISTLNGQVKGWINRNTISPLPGVEEIGRDRIITVPSPNIKPTPTPIIKPTPNVKQSPTPTPSPNAEATPPPAEDNEVLRVDTEEVSINVRVVDSNNRTVNNLNQAQFQVFEDDAPQPITALSTTEVPTINALVIDNSRSLRSQLGKIVEAGKIIVSSNRSKDQSAIVRFVSTDKIELVQDFTQNKNMLNNALDNLFVEGGQTAIIDAIYMAAKKVEQYQNSQKKEDVKLRSLILVSDGDDRSSKHTEKELFELLRQSQVQIYSIGFINNLGDEADPDSIIRQEKAKELLTRLSIETGGKVYFPNSINELAPIAIEISGELRTQYLLSYSPTNEAGNRSFRKIKVVVKDGANNEKRTAITRTGRTPTSPK